MNLTQSWLKSPSILSVSVRAVRWALGTSTCYDINRYSSSTTEGNLKRQVIYVTDKLMNMKTDDKTCADDLPLRNSSTYKTFNII